MCYNHRSEGRNLSQGVTMGLVPDSDNETRISQLLAERAQLQARVHELTVELECAGQYHPAALQQQPGTAPWALQWTG